MAGPNLVLPGHRTVATASVTTAADGLSDAVNIRGHSVAAIQTSTAWTAASLSFQGTVDGTNYYDVMTSTAGEVTVPTTASRLITLNSDEQARFAGLEGLKIRSGTSTAAVAQAAERAVILGLVRMKP